MGEGAGDGTRGVRLQAHIHRCQSFAQCAEYVPVGCVPTDIAVGQSQSALGESHWNAWAAWKQSSQLQEHSLQCACSRASTHTSRAVT